jgi:hypothetical protein
MVEERPLHAGAALGRHHFGLLNKFDIGTDKSASRHLEHVRKQLFWILVFFEPGSGDRRRQERDDPRRGTEARQHSAARRTDET